ncbi:MAG: nucleotide exchange factor GrpE [Oligoflexia bacterium]|nr:nucleotide exchange factor GrpE [Oligoflexia bacterium]
MHECNHDNSSNHTADVADATNNEIVETEETPKEPSKEPPVEEDFKSKYYYLAAEMDNMCKRFQREKENIIKFSNERLLVDLLEVVDNFERTITALQKDTAGDSKLKNIVMGVDMVRTQLDGILARYGLAPIKALGEIFDPNFHEAVSEKSAAELVGPETPENNEKKVRDMQILEEYQKGYLLHGRVVRASKVVVCRVD